MRWIYSLANTVSEAAEHEHTQTRASRDYRGGYGCRLRLIKSNIGNYQGQARKAWIKYVKKADESPIVWGDILDDETWDDILAQPTKKQVMDKLRKLRPRDAALSGDRVLHNWEIMQQLNKPVVSPPEEKLLPFKIPKIMENWVDTWIKNRVDRWDRTRLLWVKGPGRMGKTKWARSLSKNHIYLQGQFNLAELADIDNCDLIIFDDCEWKWIPQKKMLLLAKGETQLTDKYRKKQRVRIHCPAIWLTNTYDIKQDPEYETYWKEETDMVELREKLF